MAVPRNRHSLKRTRQKRVHQAMTAIQLHQCPNCQAHKKPHCLCLSCGHYKGRNVLKEIHES